MTTPNSPEQKLINVNKTVSKKFSDRIERHLESAQRKLKKNGLEIKHLKTELAELREKAGALDKVIGVETIGQRSVQLIFECGDDAEVALLPLRQIVEQKERTK